MKNKMKGKKRKFKQGIYEPINKEKFFITESFDTKNKCIKFRSSWELKFLRFVDINPYFILVNSEGVKIDYISPIDNKKHKYYVDFLVKTKDNKIILIEIKPFAQTQYPKKITESNLKTYLVNKAKWEYAEIFCKDKGIEFKIITEKELF